MEAGHPKQPLTIAPWEIVHRLISLPILHTPVLTQHTHTDIYPKGSCYNLWTDLASVSVVFGKALFGGIALRADVAAAQLLKRHLVGIDIPAVNADVSGKLLLAVGELAPKPGRGWLLV